MAVSLLKQIKSNSLLRVDNMSKKLHYFNLNALAEPIRYILHYGNQKFDDVRYERKDWPDKNIKDSLPYGQFPLYEEGNRSLNQSIAIARYVATFSNLVPSDPWEQAVLDAAVLNIYDFWYKVLDFIREQDAAKKDEKKKVILTETIDFFFSRFEKHLVKNKGFFGGKLSWADFVFVGILETTNLVLGIEVEKKYPYAAILVQKIRTLPGVKEYIATRKPYVF